MATFNNVGKFAREELFNYKKFVNNDYDLNKIMDEGSLEDKQTMDHFDILEKPLGCLVEHV
jgi:hypothetical protein